MASRAHSAWGDPVQMIFIYGPPAAGKYTIARRVADKTGYALFHNHLIVDAVAALFPFGSDNFVRLREQFWMDAMTAAARDGKSFIFTFQPEPSVSADFPARVVEMIEAHGGQVSFVRLELSPEDQLARIANQDRTAFGKLTSPDLLKRLQPDFKVCEDTMPTPQITLDTATLSPDAAASQIVSLVSARKAPK